ncbi:DUF2264 domain-containing protein [Cellulosilyticum sp. I15G10I2]|uniref:DUF2264 domain-containing protein n=1 Tax=Cellulosilyticum sp. I15G10I2 TaxID=1892843 RepID=UPI00085CB876|nr:DUF2264 domain-containing protein [Cellulosilyticum sp. I15G10I2]
MNEQTAKTRRIWVDSLIKIAHPVLYNMANDTLKCNMPIKKHKEAHDREYCTYLEALSRTLYGMAPWFNAKAISDEERQKQQYYLKLALKAIANAVDEDANDFVYIKKEGKLLPQVLVDTAFLAGALIRAKESLWDSLNIKTQKKIITYFKETREIQPYYCNWILFSSMIEAFFYTVGEDYDIVRIDYGYKQMEAWYMGDGLYSDGKDFHLDYYNSYVIQPFLVEILETIKDDYRDFNAHYPKVLERAKRYSRIQEMSIHPDGSFNPHGRSITYRMGAFHHLAVMAWLEKLPEEITAGQVRCGLTKVIIKCLEASTTFDEDGWLNIGLYGNQPSLGEVYISTGSLYLCTAVFLSLGLDDESDFWNDEDQEITMEKLWQGKDIQPDHALEK